MASTSSSRAYELYRKSSLGLCLEETLDELMNQKKIPKTLANDVLEQFDKSMNEALENKIKHNATIKGKVSNYRFVENVYMFVIKEPIVKIYNQQITLDGLKLVACDGTNTATTEQSKEKKKKKSTEKKKT